MLSKLKLFYYIFYFKSPKVLILGKSTMFIQSVPRPIIPNNDLLQYEMLGNYLCIPYFNKLTYVWCGRFIENNFKQN